MLPARPPPPSPWGSLLCLPIFQAHLPVTCQDPPAWLSHHLATVGHSLHLIPDTMIQSVCAPL